MQVLRGVAFCTALLLTQVAFGREVFHLSTGFDISASSHAVIGDRLRLVTDQGSIEIPSAQVQTFEVIPDPPSPPKKKTEAAQRQPKEDPIEVLKIAAFHEGTAPEFARLVHSVAVVESGLHTDALSPKGAIGLMQLMPSTARDLGVEAADVFQNATGGARYLAQLLQKYQYNAVLALAAYNAGPAAVDRFHGIPPFKETQDYVRRVLRVYHTFAETESAHSLAAAVR